MAIVIAALSFVGYVAVRVFGTQHGIALAALAGGLASSTATTLTFARLARDHPYASPLLAGGILLASAVMVGRVIVIAAAVNITLLAPMVWPLGAAGLVLLLAAGILLLRHGGEQREHPDLNIRNPFELGTALRMAGLIAVISFLAKVLTETFGETGLNLLAILSGIADVDAVTLSFARLSQNSLPLAAAVSGIGLAVATNTAVKAGMTFSLGTAKAGWLVAAASLAAIAAGGTALFLRGT
jgi:uncharacterized membrane protein (DUF4010 family)